MPHTDTQRSSRPAALERDPLLGVVVIGRNEGERLRACLDSLLAVKARVVYVDSGSSDGSMEMASSRGVDTLALDMSVPFTAARARNRGFEQLRLRWPNIRFVQFVDGDCEIIDDWLSFATTELECRPQVGVIAGWLRERAPAVSIFNRLADLEWNFTGVGEVESVGGIFMIRCAAFDSVGGFDPTVPAGEEPELCRRLTRQGWRLERVDRDMARHDLAMTRFAQWWRRTIRFGYGSADVAKRFGLQRFQRANIRSRLWSGWLLLVCIGIALALGSPIPAIGPWTLALFSLWPAQLMRIGLKTWRKGHPFSLAAAYAFFIVLSYFPHTVGQLLYWLDSIAKRSVRLIEHKSSGDTRTGDR